MKQVVQEGANLRAAKGFSKLLAIIIILAVAGFGDVMYIVLMGSKFPAGPLLIMCYLGAFTSFLAVGYLLLGKSVVFRPGGQFLAAWVVFVAELLIIALNILLVFDASPGGVMAAWSFISPATPVLHMLGVALIYFLDPELKAKHDAMEMQEKVDKAEREVEFLTHTARIELRKRQVAHVSKALEEAVNSAESLAHIQQFGYKLNRELLRELTGMTDTVVTPLPDGSGNVAALPEPKESDTDEQAWLNQVNDRMASERARRLAQSEPSEAEQAGGWLGVAQKLHGFFSGGASEASERDLTRIPDEQLTEEEQVEKWRIIHEHGYDYLANVEQQDAAAARRHQEQMEAARQRAESAGSDGETDGGSSVARIRPKYPRQ